MTGPSTQSSCNRRSKKAAASKPEKIVPKPLTHDFNSLPQLKDSPISVVDSNLVNEEEEEDEQQEITYVSMDDQTSEENIESHTVDAIVESTFRSRLDAVIENLMEVRVGTLCFFLWWIVAVSAVLFYAFF